MYSNYFYRIKTIYKESGYTWIFLPGGPGLGSQYLDPFCQKLELPGTTLLVDFPKDGTNKEGSLHFNYWKRGLIDLLAQFEKPILVTHSFSGMFALDTPELEPFIKGLVLINTTTANTFFPHVSAMQEQHALPDLVPEAAHYHLNPSSETYKGFWEVYRHYCFTTEELPLGEQMISQFAFNNESYHHAIEQFYPSYECRWHPKIPTLTIAGEADYICPPRIFIENVNFHSEKIINKIIKNAGHCSWLLGINEVRDCFAEFIKLLMHEQNKKC